LTIEIQDRTVTSATPTSGLTYADLIQIVELLRQSEQFSSFRLKTPELELEVLREGAPVPRTPGEPTPSAAPLPSAASVPATNVTATSAPPNLPAYASAASAAEAPVAATPAGPWRPVKSPMVGTFYAAPEPGAAPFVQPGQSVRVGDVLCIIEVMKLMNTLRAEFDGTVREVAVRDAHPVEYGQVLMQVEPA
jgi:acetyl-CoA carboxylase biotin carboxyl carrier protein